MCTGKRREEWNHTAAILATWVNMNRDQKEHPDPVRIEDIHPLMKTASNAGNGIQNKGMFFAALKATIIDQRS